MYMYHLYCLFGLSINMCNMHIDVLYVHIYAN